MTNALQVNVLVFLFTLFASAAFAGTITVDNPSFETLPAGGLPGGCGTGCAYSNAAIPGWTSTGTSGQFQPGTQDGNFNFFNSLSDGITNAYSNGGIISQIVGATVQTGVTYALQVDLGQRNDAGFTASADLLIGGVTAVPAVGLPSTRGNWSTFTASFVGMPSEAGDSITIELNSSGPQGNFDNVRLSDNLTNPVPEPSSLVLLGTGLLGLMGMWLYKG